jgi:hypothetical protein
MDNLDRLRKVLDFEGSLRHDPADRFEGYYPTVVRRLAGRDLILGDALPAAAPVRSEPIALIDIAPTAIALGEEPLLSDPPVGEVPKKGRGRKVKAAEPVVEPIVEEPVIAEIAPAPAQVGFEDEVEFVPFTQDGLPRPVEPGLLEFEELWVEHLPGASEVQPETVPSVDTMVDGAGLEPQPVIDPGAEVDVRLPAEETVVGEAELTPSAYPLTIGGYTLYAKRARLRGGERTIHFFAHEAAEGAVPVALPDGFEVERNPRSRLPYLRRIRAGPAAKSARASNSRRKTVRTSKKRTKRNP